jgi:hypothetical protein
MALVERVKGTVPQCIFTNLIQMPCVGNTFRSTAGCKPVQHPELGASFFRIWNRRYGRQHAIPNRFSV